MPYCNAMRQTQSIIITLSCSVEVSRMEITSVQAAAEAPLGHGRSAARFEFGRVCTFLQMTRSCQSNVLNCFTLDSSSCFSQWKIMLMILFKSNVYRSIGASPQKLQPVKFHATQ